jgi:hypothetical protein
VKIRANLDGCGEDKSPLLHRGSNPETYHSECLFLLRYRGLPLISYSKFNTVDLGGLVVRVLATGPKVRGFDPDRGRWIFKSPEHHFLRRGSKAVGPMS